MVAVGSIGHVRTLLRRAGHPARVSCLAHRLEHVYFVPGMIYGIAYIAYIYTYTSLEIHTATTSAPAVVRSELEYCMLPRPRFACPDERWGSDVRCGVDYHFIERSK